MGLGGLTKVTLADARKKAADARLLLSDGHDPLGLRQEEEAKRITEEKLAAARGMTFDKCAEAYIAAHEPSWRNEKHKQQWRNTIKSYVTPVFGNTAVQDIDLDLVMKVIEPIWTKKTETARRIRGRIEVILDWARVRGYRSDENPARWRGQMDRRQSGHRDMSALPPKADIDRACRDVRFVPCVDGSELARTIFTSQA
jgi:integrase-like protein/Arm domain-containing DNA-binding protein